MSKPSKRTRGRSAQPADPAASSVVRDDLTRLAAESLGPEARKRWERENARASRARQADDSTDQEFAEDVERQLRAERSRADLSDTTPLWYRIIMFGLIVIGLLWLIVWYLMDFTLPIPGIGYWNIAIGVGLMMAGLLMTTRWT